MSEQMIERILREKSFKGVRNFEEVKARFIDFARLIMCSHRLVRGDDSWTITALELYLCTGKTSEVWRDIYTHGHPEQLESGTWYVHDGGARAPTYSGIDITCGSKQDGIYGGLLVRELSKERRWIFQRIVRGNRPSFPRKGNVWLAEEKELIRTKIHKCGISTGLLRLVPTEEWKTQLYIGPRIGLRAQTGLPVENSFRFAPLRIATWQTLTNKTSMTKVSAGT